MLLLMGKYFKLEIYSSQTQNYVLYIMHIRVTYAYLKNVPN